MRFTLALLFVVGACSRDNPDFSGEGADLSGTESDLSGPPDDLAGLDLTGVDLAQPVDLAGADLTPSPFQLSIEDTNVFEGDSGITTLSFTVSLNLASTDPVTFDYGTTDGTAKTEDGDYLGLMGRLTIPPGTTSVTLEVPVQGDVRDELDETLTMTIGSPIGAGIARATATATIKDDDDAPSVSVDDSAAYEGSAAVGVSAAFRVWLDAPSGRTVTVNFATAAGSATTADYTAKTGTVTFNPGETEKQVNVSIIADLNVEGTETFSLNLSVANGAAINRASATGTIYDTQQAGQPLILTAGQMLNEGDAGATDMVFTLTTTLNVVADVKVHVSTRDATALAGLDYTAVDTDVTIPMGSNSVQVIVPILGETMSENDEGFVLVLSNPQGATIGVPMVLGRIKDDDEVPAINLTPQSDLEGDLGSSLQFTPVDLSDSAGREVSFHITTVGGGTSAAPLVDYAITTGTIRIPAGETAWEIAVPFHGDLTAEPDETYKLTPSMPVSCKLAGGSTTNTILNDD